MPLLILDKPWWPYVYDHRVTVFPAAQQWMGHLSDFNLCVYTVPSKLGSWSMTRAPRTYNNNELQKTFLHSLD